MFTERSGDPLRLAASFALLPLLAHLHHHWAVGTGSYRACGAVLGLALTALMAAGPRLTPRASALLRHARRRPAHPLAGACLWLALILLPWPLLLSSQLGLLPLAATPFFASILVARLGPRAALARGTLRSPLTLASGLLLLGGLGRFGRDLRLLVLVAAGQLLLTLTWVSDDEPPGPGELAWALFLPAATAGAFLVWTALPLAMFLLVGHFLVLGLLQEQGGSRRWHPVLGLPLLLLSLGRLPAPPAPIEERDQVVLDFRGFGPGERLEQDFAYDPTDWRLRRLLEDAQVGVYLRVVGDLDPSGVTLSLNGESLGPMASLLRARTAPMYGTPHAMNWVLELPKRCLLGERGSLTVGIDLQRPALLGYSGGIHPLPRSPHCRRVGSDGATTDLSAGRAARRFRLGWVVYLATASAPAPDGSPLIVGALY